MAVTVVITVEAVGSGACGGAAASDREVGRGAVRAVAAVVGGSWR